MLLEEAGVCALHEGKLSSVWWVVFPEAFLSSEVRQARVDSEACSRAQEHGC